MHLYEDAAPLAAAPWFVRRDAPSTSGNEIANEGPQQSEGTATDGSGSASSTSQPIRFALSVNQQAGP